MSEPSFEAACRTLEDMFPDLDPIVVRSVLDAKDGNVNEATTKLLAMSRSKRGGGGMSSSSGGGGGGGGGYGDAPRSESMANGGEEMNPYTKDARYDDDDDAPFNAFFFARPPSSNAREAFVLSTIIIIIICALAIDARKRETRARRDLESKAKCTSPRRKKCVSREFATIARV